MYYSAFSYCGDVPYDYGNETAWIFYAFSTKKDRDNFVSSEIRQGNFCKGISRKELDRAISDIRFFQPYKGYAFCLIPLYKKNFYRVRSASNAFYDGEHLYDGELLRK